MILLILSSLIVTSLFCYKMGEAKGWNDREEKFQNNPITFAVGVENALYVERARGKILVEIYNSDLVEIDK